MLKRFLFIVSLGDIQNMSKDIKKLWIIYTNIIYNLL